MFINAYKLILILCCKFSSLFCWNTFTLYFYHKKILIAFKLLVILTSRIQTVFKTTRFFTGLYHVFYFSTLLTRINSLLTFNLHLLFKIVEELVYLNFSIFTFLLNLSPFNLKFHICLQSLPNLVLKHFLCFIYCQILQFFQQLLFFFKLKCSPFMYLCSNSVYKSPKWFLFPNVDQVLFNFILLYCEPQFVLENSIENPSFGLSVSSSKKTL